MLLLFVACSKKPLDACLGGDAAACDRACAETTSACSEIADAYLGGKPEGLKADPARRVVFLEKSCASSNNEKCHRLGEAYRDGVGTTKNADKAIDAFSRSCGLDWGDGCNDLGAALLSRNAAGDEQHARESFKKACGLGNVAGCANAKRP